MSRDWESTFSAWAKPPRKTEQERCENAESVIKNAISASYKLKDRDINVFTQGSYRNSTNVRQDSDVDVGIVCYDTFFPNYPEGTNGETFKHTDSDYNYATFKNEVEQALVDYLGRNAVIRGNKAFDIKETSYHVEADVAPFFEHRRYSTDRSYLSGVQLLPDKGGRIINWPEQHYKNGVNKNTSTNRRFKSLVRIIKSLCNEMSDEGIAEAKPIIGFIIECLVWNVPNKNFGHSTYRGDVRACLAFLFNNTMTNEKCSEWGEVSELQYLFRGHQKCTSQQVHSFLSEAWNYIGFE